MAIDRPGIDKANANAYRKILARFNESGVHTANIALGVTGSLELPVTVRTSASETFRIRKTLEDGLLGLRTYNDSASFSPRREYVQFIIVDNRGGFIYETEGIPTGPYTVRVNEFGD